jgi:Fic family protein
MAADQHLSKSALIRKAIKAYQKQIKNKEIIKKIQASFYLLTRIAYLQPFQDGNKRTSRAMCNIPLINANLPPISFVDFAKKDYIISMLAFYELGDIKLAESCFIEAYKRSIERLK